MSLFTPLKFNTSPLRHDAWKTFSFRFGKVNVQGRAVSFREGRGILVDPLSLDSSEI